MASPHPITVRGAPPELVRRLEALAPERGESMNATALHVLGQALGTDDRRRRLARYATWTSGDAVELEAALRAQRTVDPTTREMAARHGVVFAGLRRAGTPIPINDDWIAAATLVEGAHLVTFDDDHDAVPGLPFTSLLPA